MRKRMRRRRRRRSRRRVVDDAPLTSTEIRPEHGLDDGMYEKSRSEADDAQLILRNVDMKIESFKPHKPHGPL